MDPCTSMRPALLGVLLVLVFLLLLPSGIPGLGDGCDEQGCSLVRTERRQGLRHRLRLHHTHTRTAESILLPAFYLLLDACTAC